MTSPDQPSKQARPSKPDRNRWRADLKAGSQGAALSVRAAPAGALHASPAVDGVLDAAAPVPIAMRQDQRLAPTDEEHRDAHGGQGGLALGVRGQAAQGAGVPQLQDLVEDRRHGTVEAGLGVAALEVSAAPGAGPAVGDLLQAPPQVHAAEVQRHGLHVQLVLGAGLPGVQDEAMVSACPTLLAAQLHTPLKAPAVPFVTAADGGHRADLLPDDRHAATAAGVGVHGVIEAARAATAVRPRSAGVPGFADAFLVVAAAAGRPRAP
eukprot:CAMPEP_0171212618 /NCGR_PEP_ID=MMETSP0790-20130122/30225_1 /TAXON_ID=2925 /ORGANISM="Alexandrium catenella, Strain OF101" /LENGTH=265 /DNA_ID=CAMNT_0011678307 /DNA_START=307 /DNA_END=1103 /DNA_ORIENTATION=-